ncbi:methyltransferase FkbM family protein [Thauera linaloolentis 47Lol = DSM 12138]|uniref:Methyltransferase FkbM family protein n=2 Tax=Thauera linaloolentis TaxID=76112 RepID=N6YXK4_THAL4|nr:methyltransferase FkbM family protein [Thauera linaloolentis 47Lol = DSM 12138]
MFYEGASAPFVLDIGANLGAYAIAVAQDLQKLGGAVHAYEAQRLVYYQLCGNLILNRLDNVHAFHMAIGHEDGSIEIPQIDYASSENIGGFSLDQVIRDKVSAVTIDQARRAERVAMARLDSIAFPKTADLIKIDVEGFELRVLEGGVGFLEAGGFPPLILEAWRDEWFRERRAELMAFLARLGYACFEVLDEVVAQHPQHPRHVDFVVQGDGGLQLVRTR